MQNIFVYGTLMFDNVWERVVTRRYQKQAAILPGFKRLQVKGEKYPGLVRSFAGAVQGFIYFDVTARDVGLLDKFEGEYYCRRRLRVRTADGRVHTASAYVFGRRYRRLLGVSSWDPQRFQARYLSGFIKEYKGT